MCRVPLLPHVSSRPGHIRPILYVSLPLLENSPPSNTRPTSFDIPSPHKSKLRDEYGTAACSMRHQLLAVGH
jgi:hypothetical protein